MSEKQVGIAVLNWGTVNETWGYADNITEDDEADKEQIKDGVGDTVGVIFSDIRKKISADYTPLAAAEATDPPKKEDIIGTQITIKTMAAKTKSFVVDGATKKYSKGAITTWSVNGYYYPNMTVA